MRSIMTVLQYGRFIAQQDGKPPDTMDVEALAPACPSGKEDENHTKYRCYFLVLAGATRFLQGINVLPGSFMTGQITIAKINLDAVIVEGTSRKSLKLGPGHVQDSAPLGSSCGSGGSIMRMTI
jgi:hypothetical protein